jgi:hypothetical protein
MFSGKMGRLGKWCKVRTHKYRQPHSFKYKNSQTGSKDGAVCVIYSGLLKVRFNLTSFSGGAVGLSAQE